MVNRELINSCFDDDKVDILAIAITQLDASGESFRRAFAAGGGFFDRGNRDREIRNALQSLLLFSTKVSVAGFPQLEELLIDLTDVMRDPENFKTIDQLDAILNRIDRVSNSARIDMVNRFTSCLIGE